MKAHRAESRAGDSARARAHAPIAPDPPDTDGLGAPRYPLCREPWENFYILRRGVMPCCYGTPVIAAMPDYAAAWNSPALQEIRSYLSRGRLSPYCLESRSCPIVKRVVAAAKAGDPAAIEAAGLPRPKVTPLQRLNRLCLGVPGRLRRALRKRGT